MTERQRIIQTLRKLDNKTLLEIARRLDVLDLYDVRCRIELSVTNNIKEVLKDMRIIKG